MNQNFQQPLAVFTSYAHEDAPLRIELRKHMQSLIRQRRIVEWHDRQIVAGTDWRKEIDARIETAHIVLLLVSPDFMHSEYCYETEMRRALTRHIEGKARVVPVLLRDVYWRESAFSNLQVLPSNGTAVCNVDWPSKDAAFLDVTIGIRKVVADLCGEAIPDSEVPIPPKRIVEVTLAIQIEQFTPELRSLLISSLVSEMSLSGPVHVVSIRAGSTIVTLELTTSDAMKLTSRPISRGLRQIGVRSIALQLLATDPARKGLAVQLAQETDARLWRARAQVADERQVTVSEVDASIGVWPDEPPETSRTLELLARAQLGDVDALDSLLRSYQSRLTRIVRIQLGASVLSRDFDEMDIVQETFRAALPKISEYHPKSEAGFLQWLALIATNLIRDLYDRKLARAYRIPEDQDPANAVLREASTLSDGRAPDEIVARKELLDMVDSAVASLPGDQRRVVLLRDYCGADWEKVAAEVDRGVGAARQLHERAWTRLRAILKNKLK